MKKLDIATSIILFKFKIWGEEMKKILLSVKDKANLCKVIDAIFYTGKVSLVFTLTYTLIPDPSCSMEVKIAMGVLLLSTYPDLVRLMDCFDIKSK